MDFNLRYTLRECAPFNWRKLANDKEARFKNMCTLVRDLLKKFEADDFDDTTFKEMAHCFVTEEPGTNADETKWRNLVNALVAVARSSFKSVTGRAAPKSRPIPDEEIPVFDGDLLGTDE